MAVLKHFSNDVERIFNKVETISSASTLTEADSGKWYELNNSTGVVVTLPAVKSGVNFRFVVGAAFATDNFVIDSAEGDNINGILVVNGASVSASGEDQINFVASAETVGDFIDVWSDGSGWYVWGIGNTAGSITATDPS